MPELAEVETTKRDLRLKILNQRIKKVEVNLDKVVFNKKDDFIKKTENKTIFDIKRRGKWLIFELDDIYIIIHFRMEGRFYLKDKASKKEKHDYVIFYLDDYNLHYNDPRLFGNMQIIEKEKLDDFFKEKKLGLEYDDANLTPKYLKKCFSNHNTYIKNMLLDQSYITGIGNIYADEILFRSKISPWKKACKLSIKELEGVINNTKIVFEESLKYKGTYPNIDGKRGIYEKYLQVHKRLGEKCYICGEILKKDKVGQRGTYYCPTCQK